ncbi:hypothetical protein PVK06_046617 [Gossypium arboreum]|uniref:Isopenicillin N synthase-like Fe(2+) 2OG dioxygenase domain-containing protein n=1 Tax=Gossypium arboreum TaxID=29729 RepID=A0ABR0MBG3_GOSAR|nr:hypothetical protein PVK06_046617 [Gossypium arboreum]
MGLPARSDHGLLTFLIQKDTLGLQVLHKDKWVNIPIPNIWTNGNLRSVLYRVVVNDKDVRILIALANGRAADTAVSLAPMLMEDG